MSQRARNVQSRKVEQENARKAEYEKIRKALAHLIIVEELPFHLVEDEAFKEFTEALSGDFQLPSSTMIAKDCVQIYKDEKLKLKSFFKKRKQRVSLTLDTWISPQTDIYLCITAHVIDNNWDLHKKIIGFRPVFNLECEDVRDVVESCLKDWELTNVTTITSRNEILNDNTLTYLRQKLANPLLGGKFLHMSCVVDFINSLVKDCLKKYDDSITRARDAIRYFPSPDRIKMLKECAKESGIDVTNPLLYRDNSNRWNSTFEMLKSFEKLEKAFKLFEIKDDVYKLYMEEECGGVPTCDDWNNVKRVTAFLDVFYRLIEKMYESSVASNQAFCRIADLDVHLRKWAKSSDIETTIMALEMRKSFNKHWGKVEEINILSYVAIVLDPRYKMEFIEFSFENLCKQENTDGVDETGQSQSEWKKKVELVRATMFELFNAYNGKTAIPQESTNLQSCDYELEELFKKRKMDVGGNIKSKTELDQYLNELCEDDVKGFDILRWWKKNSSRFPILSKIAKDVLAIPVTAVAPESVFTVGGNVITEYRGYLPILILEGLVCAQDWIRKSRKPIKVEEDLIALEAYEDGDNFGHMHMGQAKWWYNHGCENGRDVKMED